MDDRQPPNTLLSPGEDMSPTEQEVIDEYVRLADNMKKVRFFGFGEGGRRLLPPPGGKSNHHTCSANPSPGRYQKQLASILDTMAARPTTEILDGLRELERKTALVFTLLKTSVYSIVLQQELDWGEQAQQ